MLSRINLCSGWLPQMPVSRRTTGSRVHGSASVKLDRATILLDRLQSIAVELCGEVEGLRPANRLSRRFSPAQAGHRSSLARNLVFVACFVETPATEIDRR